MVFKHVDSETGQWLSPIDSFLSSNLTISQQSNRILEIGVYKGAWLIDMLMNQSRLSGFGIDPYPGMPKIKDRMFENMNFYEVSRRFQLFKNYEGLSSDVNGLKFASIHIDGEHTERAVKRDLEFAQENICDDGLIIVDDLFHPDFPGIPSAVYNFLRTEDFASFLITDKKMFICRKRCYEMYRLTALSLLSEHRLNHNLGDTPIYEISQDNSVSGFAQIKVPNQLSDRRARRNLGLVVLKRKEFSRYNLRRSLLGVLKAVLPGFVFATIRHIIKYKRDS
jgi:hypothetical protein